MSNGDNLTKLIDWSPRTPVSRYLMSRINSIHLLLAFPPLSNSQSELPNVKEFLELLSPTKGAEMFENDSI